MQAQAGLLPPQVMFPGQVSAAIAAQGGIGAFGALFPTQTYQTAIGSPQIFQGATGLMTPLNPAAPMNPYAPANPYAGLSSYGSLSGLPSAFAPSPPTPPPAYAGLPGTGALPFAPPPMPSPFDTPYGSQVAHAHAAHARAFTAGQAGAGSLAHAGANMAGAFAGAALGGMAAGPVGALVGGVAGFIGAERMGVGRAARNLYGNQVAAPALSEFGASLGIEHLSQGFTASGAHLHASGSGFSARASHEAAASLTEMSNSSSFRRETRDRFNQQDVYRITQGAGEAGLLSGAGSPSAMVSRVRETAKSLSAFMELAKEPAVQRAIQTMGSLRSAGFNLQETLSAISAGRSYARAAGTTFQALSEVGGALGSQTFSSMGMTSGLGYRAGMGAYSGAATSINQGVLNPQLSSLVGGREGLATLNTMFSGTQLQLPMVAAGLMGTRGGLDLRAMQSYLGGGANVFGLPSQGAGNLGALAGARGVGGLGMSLAMQPLLQDTIGRAVQDRGTFAGRNMEDESILRLARQFGMSGSDGFSTAAQSLGMQGSASIARVTELQSPTYWATQRAQLRTDRREQRALDDRAREDARPGIGDSLMRDSALGDVATGIGSGLHHLRMGLSRATYGSERGDTLNEATTDGARRRLDALYGSDSFGASLNRFTDEQRRSRTPLGMGLSERMRLARADGSGHIGALAAGIFGGGGGADEVRDFREGGQHAAAMLASTTSDQRSAMDQLSETFGSMDALMGFQRRAAALARDANGAGGVAASRLTLGLGRGTRAVRGSDLREAFAAELRARGVSEEEISRRWDRKSSTIGAQHAAARGFFDESNTERETWAATGDQDTALSRGGTGFLRTARDAGRAGAEAAIGDQGREGREGLSTVLDNVEGLGPEGSARNRTSRQYMSALVLARIASRDGGGARERAEERIREIVSRASRPGSGLSQQDLFAMRERTDALARNYQNDERVQVAARGFLGRGADVDALGRADEALTTERGATNVASGFAALGRRGGGELASLFGGVSVDNFDERTVRSNVLGMRRDALGRLRAQRGGRAYADAIARLQGGDERGMAELRSLAGRVGEGDRALEREYDEQHQGIGGRISRALGWYDSSRQRWVDERSRATSGAQRDLDRQGQESAGTEMAVRRAGIGTPGDALVEVARDLREVTHNLREVVQTRHTAALLGGSM